MILYHDTANIYPNLHLDTVFGDKRTPKKRNFMVKMFFWRVFSKFCRGAKILAKTRSFLPLWESFEIILVDLKKGSTKFSPRENPRFALVIKQLGTS